MELHNHPSYIEPYQGAATGVGGILRDVFTMGARPVACLNLLRFGAPDHPKTRHLVAGVVAGDRRLRQFLRRADGRRLGRLRQPLRRQHPGQRHGGRRGARRRDLLRRGDRVGNPIVYLGSKTGRDGIHGASMASAAFEADAEEKRPTVQVGDPFAEKLLLEACLELMASGAVVAIQDMGAAGLTSSAVEMGAKGNLGVDLDLDRRALPRDRHDRLRDAALREPGAHADGAQARDTGRGRGHLPQMGARLRRHRPDHRHASASSSGTAARSRPTCRSRSSATRRRSTTGRGRRPRPRPSSTGRRSSPPLPTDAALLKLLGSPNSQLEALGLRAIRFADPRQHRAGAGRRRGGHPPRRRAEGPCADDRLHRALLRGRPARRRQAGGRGGLAQPRRRRREAAGADRQPQFRQPREAATRWASSSAAIAGIGEAARALDFPIVSGNVSLYNETMGAGIPPTPAIGGVGLVADVTKTASPSFKARGPRHPADRRRARLARPLGLARRGRGPRRGRAAAGRPRRRAAQRRIRRAA